MILVWLYTYSFIFDLGYAVTVLYVVTVSNVPLRNVAEFYTAEMYSKTNFHWSGQVIVKCIVYRRISSSPGFLHLPETLIFFLQMPGEDNFTVEHDALHTYTERPLWVCMTTDTCHSCKSTGVINILNKGCIQLVALAQGSWYCAGSMALL